MSERREAVGTEWWAGVDPESPTLYECEYCPAVTPYLCERCGDPVCEAKHSVPTPEGGRLCPDCEDTASDASQARE